MDTETIRQRRETEDTTSGSPKTKSNKMILAKRGLKSLIIAVATPLLLTAGTSYLLGGAATSPSMWAFHFLSLSSAVLMGLSAWLVWADGGFRRHPVALRLYAAELLLSLLWAPLVFGAGAVKTGLVVCGGLFLALIGCSRAFKRCNPVAGDLVKPCLAWACFLAIFNYRLM